MTSLAQRSLYILYPQSWPPARDGPRAKATITNMSRARQRRSGGGSTPGTSIPCPSAGGRPESCTPALGDTSIPGTSILRPSTGVGTSIRHPRVKGGHQHPGDQTRQPATACLHPGEPVPILKSGGARMGSVGASSNALKSRTCHLARRSVGKAALSRSLRYGQGISLLCAPWRG